MRTVTPEQLADIIAKHQLWLNNDEGGSRADLSVADLRAAIVAALAAGRTAREVLAELDREEQGDE